MGYLYKDEEITINSDGSVDMTWKIRAAQLKAETTVLKAEIVKLKEEIEKLKGRKQ